MEVVVINGAPGAGKSAVANAISEVLRLSGEPHAVIDLDELARVYPEEYPDLGWDNLAAVWPNYAAIPGLRLILPVLVETQEQLTRLQRIAVTQSIRVVELVASEESLKDRVSKREPNEYWPSQLRDLVGHYLNENPHLGEFTVDTDKASPEIAAKTIVNHVGWL